MSKKVAIVTGGSKDLGLDFVRALCSNFEGDVYLTASDAVEAHTAVKLLKEEGLHANCHQLDINNPASIHAFGSFIKNNYGEIDVLVNNAAIEYKITDPTPFSEKAMNTIKTNFFGTLNVCNELLPMMREYAKVFNVAGLSSGIHQLPSIELRLKLISPSLTEEELIKLMNQFVEDAKANLHEKNGWGSSAYEVSKIGISVLSSVLSLKILKYHAKFIRVKTFYTEHVDMKMEFFINSIQCGFQPTEPPPQVPLSVPVAKPNSARALSRAPKGVGDKCAKRNYRFSMVAYAERRIKRAAMDVQTAQRTYDGALLKAESAKKFYDSYKASVLALGTSDNKQIQSILENSVDSTARSVAHREKFAEEMNKHLKYTKECYSSTVTSSKEIMDREFQRRQYEAISDAHRKEDWLRSKIAQYRPKNHLDILTLE